MFIISIPVYSFLAIPILITLGGQKKEGTITSIGIIDFGLFLFVFCIGHIAYLSTYSIWMACMLVLNVIICDIISNIIDRKINIVLKKFIMKYLIPVPFAITLTLLLSGWTTIPKMHSIILGLMIPALVIVGNHTITYIKSDLGITKENLRPGKGLIIDNIQSFLFTAPIVFHYIRYFVL
jgi:phosphatidate cytidylyltransferase